MTHDDEMAERALVTLAQSAEMLSKDKYTSEHRLRIAIEIMTPDDDVRAYAIKYGRSSIPGIYHLTFDDGLVTFVVHT